MKPESMSVRDRACSAAPVRARISRGSSVSRRVADYRQLAVAGWFAVGLGLGAATLGAFDPALARADEATPAAASALPPAEIERQAEAISRSIMSPFCPGRTVSACPNAGPWRDEIRKWVAEGVDSQEIKRRLGERVPEHNLTGVPKNRLGWVLPVGLGIGAIGILVFLLRYLVSPRSGGTTRSEQLAQAKDAKATATATPAASRSGDDYDARLEQELDTLEQ